MQDMMMSEPFKSGLRVSGRLLNEEQRQVLIGRQNANELDSLEFEAVVYEDGSNSNHYRFRGNDLHGFAISFAGQPFLRNHDVDDIASRDGIVVESKLDDGFFAQRIRLTTERGIRSFLEGQIDRFSIGWYFDSVTCSICDKDFFQCEHWPGQKYDGQISEIIFENPRGKETSAVNAPAVEGTHIISVLCEQKKGMMMKTEEVQKDELSGSPPIAVEQSIQVEPSPPVAEPDVEPTLLIEEKASDWMAYLRQQALDAALVGSGLPVVAQDAVRSELDRAGGDISPSLVDDAIGRQRTLLAALREDQVIQNVRPIVSGMMDSMEKMSVALEALIGGVQPKGVRPLSGIREAYIELSGDYELHGKFLPENVGLANVTSTTMAGLVASALNKVVINQFQEYPRWWEPFVTIEDFSNLNTVRWITLGGVGELPTVAEGAAYTEMTWDDQTETASWAKKGGYLGITLETIDRDDVRQVQRAPRALAQAAWLTLSKLVANIFTDNSGTGPTMSDSIALFNASHNNLGTTALSPSGWETTRTAMRKQTELNSGERLGGLVVPKYLLVPPDLEGTALQVLMSEGEAGTANNDENPWAEGEGRSARLESARRRTIVIDLWTDTDNWAAVADPIMYPSIGMGFRYGRTPEIFSVADSGSGLMFSNDVMPIKVRFFAAVGPTDWRGLYKHNV